MKPQLTQMAKKKNQTAAAETETESQTEKEMPPHTVP